MEPEQRKRYALSVIGFGSLFAEFVKVEPLIDGVLAEFGEALDRDTYFNLVLSKANCAAVSARRLMATSMYQRVIGSDANSVIRAWAQRGLSSCLFDPAEKARHLEAARDLFLESGHRRDAIAATVSMSDIHSTLDPDRALVLLREAAELDETGKILSREVAASIHLHRARLLFDLNRIREALEAAEVSCALREELIGNEVERYSSHRTAEALAKLLGDADKAESHQAAASAVLTLINDPALSLRCEVEHFLSAKQSIPDELVRRVHESDDARLKFAVSVVRSSDKSLSIDLRLESLDTATRLSEGEGVPQQDKALVRAALGDLHFSTGRFDDAVKANEGCLELNPYSHHALQNCTAILINNRSWPKAELFLRKQIDRLGKLPGLEFAYGRALLEQGRHKEALKAFLQSRKSGTIPNLEDYIKDCVEHIDESELEPPFEGNEPRKVTLDEFKLAVHDFSSHVSSDNRKAFWRHDGQTKKHVWKPGPEAVGKHLLIAHLNGRFGKGAIEVLQEVPAGAGILDLYVMLWDRLKIVVELKVCGLGYSSGYALRGEDQLLHYMKSRDSRIGMLVVFDGRVRDFGKDFRAIQFHEDIVVFTVAVDVRPLVAEMLEEDTQDE